MGSLGTHLLKENKQASVEATTSLYGNFFDNEFLRGESTPFEQMRKISGELEKLQAPKLVTVLGISGVPAKNFRLRLCCTR